VTELRSSKFLSARQSIHYLCIRKIFLVRADVNIEIVVYVCPFEKSSFPFFPELRSASLTFVHHCLLRFINHFFEIILEVLFRAADFDQPNCVCMELGIDLLSECCLALRGLVNWRLCIGGES